MTVTREAKLAEAAREVFDDMTGVDQAQQAMGAVSRGLIGGAVVGHVSVDPNAKGRDPAFLTQPEVVSQRRVEELASSLRPAHPINMLVTQAEREFRNLQSLRDYMQKAAEAAGPMPAEAQAALADLFWKAKGPR